MHAINIESPAQVIDLVLEYARVPSGGLNHFFLSAFVQKFHSRGARSRDESGKTRKAEASFEELGRFSTGLRNSRVDDDVKWDGQPVALSKLLCGDVLVIFLPVFNHRELQGKAHLRSRKPHAWRIVHDVSHGLDQFPDFLAGDLCGAQRPGLFPQNWVPGLYDLEFHNNLDSRAHPPSVCARSWA